MNGTNQSFFNHSNASHATALWEWNRYLKGFLRQMSTFRKRNCGWWASCTVWQFHRHIGDLESKNKIKKRQKPTTPISQKVTHPSSTFNQQGLTSVTSKSTWLIAIWDDDDKTDPKYLRGLPTNPTSLHQNAFSRTHYCLRKCLKTK